MVVGLGSAVVNAVWIGRHIDSLERLWRWSGLILSRVYRDIVLIRQKVRPVEPAGVSSAATAQRLDPYQAQSSVSGRGGGG